MVHLLIALALAGAPQVSGVPETLVSDPCNLGRDDGAHAAHTCPADYSESDCWWAWHCCEDSHGHKVEPFLRQLFDCRGGCTAASTLVGSRTCAPHPGVHITDAGLAAYCQRYPDCGFP